MTEVPTVEPTDARPSGHRAVPLLAEPDLGHYPRFRDFLTSTFDLTPDRVGGPGLVSVAGRHYEIVFTGRSGSPFPSGAEIHALVPGLEPLDEGLADEDLWAILCWLVEGVGGSWSAESLLRTGRIYQVPAASGGPSAPVPDAGPDRSPREALVFDLYGTLVDPLAIAEELARVMPAAEARRLAGVWRRTQLEYSFRLTVMNRYADFSWVTERALERALLECDQQLSPPERARVLGGYQALAPFLDVGPALATLARRGYRMVLLSNGNTSMLGRSVANAGLAPYLEQVISVDEVRAFKPHPAVYRMAARTLQRPIGRLRLVSCNPFDVVGAASVGMRTAWVNRTGGPFDTLGAQPDLTITSLAELAESLAAAGDSGEVRNSPGDGR